MHRYAAAPRARKVTEIDLRFMNLRDEAAFARAAACPWVVREQFPRLVAHSASRFRFPGDEPEAALAFKTVVESKSPLLLERFLAGEERLRAGDFRDEPVDVYFIG